MEEKNIQISNAETCVPPSPVFVYESHPSGTHTYGDAKIAKEQYGAVDGFAWVDMEIVTQSRLTSIP